MDITDEGIALIKRFEGLSLDAYQDIAGIWTIGYGHTTGVTPGQRITEAEAEALLRDELDRFENGVNSAVKVDINPNEFSALVSFSYNVGLGALRSSTALRRLNAGDRMGAADALTWWNKATVDGRKVVVRGLTRRRAAERALFLKPYPDVGFSPSISSVEDNSRLAAEEGGPRRDNLSESRTIQGASAAGVTGVAAVATGGHQARQIQNLEQQAIDCLTAGNMELPECQDIDYDGEGPAPAAPSVPMPETRVPVPEGEEEIFLDETMAEARRPEIVQSETKEVFQDIYMQLFAAFGVIMVLSILFVIWARIDDWQQGKR